MSPCSFPFHDLMFLLGDLECRFVAIVVSEEDPT